MKTKISILCANLSTNAFGRAYILAKVLQKRWPVEIVGPVFEGKIWYPLRYDTSVSLKAVPINDNTNVFSKLRKLLHAVSPSLIYASKPLMTSYGVGLIKKITKGKPLILDIDDWELGFVKEYYKGLSFLEKVNNFAASFRSHYYYWNIFFMEKLIFFADAITVSNSFLKNKFGGIVVPHGRDTDSLQPERFDSKAIKQGLGLSDKKIIAYVGTPRIHKGLEDLVEAVSIVGRDDTILLLVGVTDKDSRLCSLAKEKIGKNKTMFLKEQPFSEIGKFLAISDVVVIPQKKNWATKGQIPAKIFDAMAMAKPVVSTNVSDIPGILKDCGMVAEAGNANDLADKIRILLEDSNLARKLGEQGRQKCIENYSWNAMGKQLFPLFEKFDR